MAVVKPASKGALMQKLVATSLASLMFAGTLVNPTFAEAQSGTTTPIKHLVVIFQENVSFDHYFGTYPKALNPAGRAALSSPSPERRGEWPHRRIALQQSQFLNTRQRSGAQPTPSASIAPKPQPPIRTTTTLPEQQAFHGGLMDSFPKYTGTPGPPPNGQTTTGLVMGYYDGNTVTALLELCPAVCHE